MKILARTDLKTKNTCTLTEIRHVDIYILQINFKIKFNFKSLSICLEIIRTFLEF